MIVSKRTAILLSLAILLTAGIGAGYFWYSRHAGDAGGENA